MLIRNGRPVVEDVPPPSIAAGTVLVRVAFSCLSPGTELSGIRASAQPLWKRALREPEKIGRVLQIVRDRGVSAALGVVQSQVDRALTTGYSAAGIVTAVGAGVTDLAPGQAVACAGSLYAHHAEVIRVPRNLVVPVPEGLSLEHASTVTLGAIALQGVRRFSPTLGEVCVVMGLGLIGQLTVQMLKANGCRVIGLDVDPARIELARALGADVVAAPGATGEIELVMRMTDGHGVDGVIVTAASDSDELISTAFRMCRRKGRVVLVGDVGLNLRRADIYERELDFLVSTSYGPGRYDRSYEEDGLEYPIGYVRWTENRNMTAYLDLLAQGQVLVETLFADPIDLESAVTAYAALEQRERLGAVLRYRPDVSEVQPTRIANPAPVQPRPGVVRLAIVGAGAFTKSTHLPLLRELSDRFAVAAVAGRGGPNAQEVARQFGARYATSDWRDVLGDPDIDAVLIATRHDQHATMALQALQAGKHVLLEKPLALRRAELDEIRAWFSSDRIAPVLLTGYNRRFSPPIAAVRSAIAARTNPMILNYRLNAGRLPDDHWVFGAEGGGRNLGEACHVYDLFTSLAAVAVEGISASAIRPRTGYYRKDDNFVATIRFADGSVASLIYTALGSDRFPKERLEVYCDGTVIEMDDYREVRVHGRDGANQSFRGQQKGWREELEAFHAAVTGRTPWPIPLWEQLQSADIALEVEAQLQDPAHGNG